MRHRVGKGQAPSAWLPFRFFLDKALDEFKKIDRARQKIIKAKLLILAKNPAALKNSIKRLSSPDEVLYRLRVGAYRVIFKKVEERLVILVVRIGHRKETNAE